jgi:hypothetical protein
VVALITVGFTSFFIFENVVENNVGATSTWAQISYDDFKNGIFNNTTLSGTGENAELNIDISVMDYWIKKEPVNNPTANQWFAMASIYGTDKVILFGGLTLSSVYTCYNETWVYDLSKDTWTNMSPKARPGARYGHAMASIYGTDKIVLFGGAYIEPLGGIDYYNDTWIYDLSENNWTQKVSPNSPSARRGHAMVSINTDDKLILYGSSNYGADTWVFDLSNNTWTMKTPTNNPGPRAGHAMAAINGTDIVVLFGGNKSGSINNETWTYKLSDNIWTQKMPSNKPCARVDHAMASIYNYDKILLFGGRTNNINSWTYHFSSNTWMKKNLSVNPGGRYGHAMASIYNDDKIVLYGGVKGSQSSQINDTWVFDNSASTKNGTYISSPFDTGANSSFYKINWLSIIPDNTSIKFQLRTADNESNLLNKTFIGPEGKSSKFYETTLLKIWFGHNGDRWIQYIIYFNATHTKEVPRLKNISISYNLWPVVSLVDPANGFASSNNKPVFMWDFVDLDSEQQTAFQLLISNNSTFNNIVFDSKIQYSTKQYWQFPIGTDYTDLPDGTWFWKVRTKDNDGDWGVYSHPWKLLIDTVIPKSKIMMPCNNTYYKVLTNISGIAVDPINGTGLGIVEISLKNLSDNNYWDGFQWQSVEFWLLATGTTNWFYSLKQNILTSGYQYLVHSRATDNAINVEHQNAGKLFFIDAEDVIFSDFYPLIYEESATENVEVGITISDNISGVNGSNMKYTTSTDDGMTWEPWQSIDKCENRKRIDITLNLTFPNGIRNKIKWQACDIAGNGPQESIGYPIKINTWLIPPNVILQTPSNGSIIQSNSIELSWMLEKRTFLNVTYDLYLDNENILYEINKSVDGSTTIKIHNLINGQTYYWTVISRIGDNYGTCMSGVWEFRVELPDPYVILNSPENSSTIESVSPTLDWTLEYSGLEIITFDVYFGTKNNFKLIIENYPNMNFTLTKILENGQTYHWKIIPRTGENNGIESETWSFKIKEEKFLPDFGLKLTIHPQKIELGPNSMKYVKATVTNLGELNDTISLEVLVPDGAEIIVIVKEPKINEILPGGSAEFNLTVLAANNAQNAKILLSVVAESIKAVDYELIVKEEANLTVKIHDVGISDEPERNWFIYNSWNLLIIILLILFIIITLIIVLNRKNSHKQEVDEIDFLSESNKIQTSSPLMESSMPEIQENEPDVETMESFKNQMDIWKSEGYNVSRLENLYSSDENMFVKVFSIFSSNISRLKTISAKLETMKIEGYKTQVNSIKNKLFEPDLALSAFEEFNDLKDKIESKSLILNVESIPSISTTESIYLDLDTTEIQQPDTIEKKG